MVSLHSYSSSLIVILIVIFFLVIEVFVSKKRHQIIKTKSSILQLITTKRGICKFSLLLLEMKNTFLYRPFNRKLVDVDITGLSKTMGSIKCLVLQRISALIVLRDCSVLHTSRAGFHHMSTNMTLLQAVRFRPVFRVSSNCYVISESTIRTSATSLEGNKNNLH